MARPGPGRAPTPSASRAPKRTARQPRRPPPPPFPRPGSAGSRRGRQGPRRASSGRPQHSRAGTHQRKVSGSKRTEKSDRSAAAPRPRHAVSTASSCRRRGVRLASSRLGGRRRPGPLGPGSDQGPARPAGPALGAGAWGCGGWRWRCPHARVPPYLGRQLRHPTGHLIQNLSLLHLRGRSSTVGRGAGAPPPAPHAQLCQASWPSGLCPPTPDGTGEQGLKRLRPTLGYSGVRSRGLCITHNPEVPA